MKKKIIFMSYVIKAWHFESRFFIEHLVSNGFEVEYWDLSALFNADFGKSLDNCYVKKFNSRLALTEEIKQNTQSSFVMLFNLEYRFFWVYRLLTIYNCKVFFFSWGEFPMLTKKTIHKIYDAIRLPKNIYKKYFMLAVDRLDLVKKFDIVFFDSYRSRELFPGANQYISIHPPEFETYCDLIQSKPMNEKLVSLPKEKYLVFLDSNLPFNIDAKRNNLKNVSPQKYQAGINTFFNKLEKSIGLKIIIAGHPKSDYSPDFFEGRPIFKWKTAQLVMNAQVVISHYSTSTNYAVLWKKPIIFACNDDFSRLPGTRYRMLITAAMAKELAMPLYNMDHLPETITFSEVDDCVYEKYREKYVTVNTSCDLKNKDIILKAFLNS